MQGGAEVLGEEKNTLDTGVQAEADGNVHEAILTPDGYGRFGAVPGQRKETTPLAAP
jgi:hypothetical protein